MFAAIYIPNFPVQVAQRYERDEGRPLALIDVPGPKSCITHVNAQATVVGVIPGMSPTQGLARHGRLLIRKRSTVQETAAQIALLQCAGCFSPAVEDTAPGTCTLDLAGLTNLCPSSPQLWADKVIRSVALIQLRARVGVAASPLVAGYAARAAQEVRVVTEAQTFLDRLPVAMAGSSDQLLDLLRRWGLRTLGEVRLLGLAALTERLGPEGLELYQRASGQEQRPLKRVVATEIYTEEIELDYELETAEPLLLLLRQFLEQICARQQMAFVVTEELDLLLRFVKGRSYRRQFVIPAPTGVVTTLWRVLQTHLENLTTEEAIIGVRLSARACQPKQEQLSLFAGALRDPNQFGITLGRLGALLGSDRVGFPVREDSHRPDAIQVRPLTATAESTPPGSGSLAGARIGPALRRFRPPIPAVLTMGMNGPAYLRSQVLNGAIRKAQGPWRSSGHWWDAEKWRREEWDVETNSGTLARVFRQDDAWFVEGFYD